MGNNCQITVGVRLLTHGGGHVLRDTKPGFDTFGKITIGDYVYIGNNSLIMPGVTIGSNVIIGAGSIVTKDIPSDSVCVGIPCKVIGSFEDFVEKRKA